VDNDRGYPGRHLVSAKSSGGSPGATARRCERSSTHRLVQERRPTGRFGGSAGLWSSNGRGVRREVCRFADLAKPAAREANKLEAVIRLTTPEKNHARRRDVRDREKADTRLARPVRVLRDVRASAPRALAAACRWLSGSCGRPPAVSHGRLRAGECRRAYRPRDLIGTNNVEERDDC